MMARRIAILAGLVIVLIAVNWQIARKERVLREGTSILLALAPVDPRSLMQGDYMRLDYAIAREIGWRNEWPNDGQIVIRTDGDGVAAFVRRHEGAPLAPGEHLLLYRRRGGRIRIGTDAYFFEEGTAWRYDDARYGELRVDADGESLLVGLRDAQRRALDSTQAP